MHTLYKLTFKSGKSYIGQTVSKMQTRFTQHRAAANRGSKLPVHCAWRAHGEPELQVIGSYDSHEELHQAEISAIASHGTLAPKGYNVGYGGETAPSKNPDVARKIAEKAKGRKHLDTSPWREATKARWENEESREKMLEGMRSCWTDEMRKAAGERSKARWEKRRSEGWVMPDSQKEKLSNRIVSDETRNKMSNAAKGKKKAPRSEGTCRKLSESVKKSWQDREHSEKRVKSIKAAWDDDARAVMGQKAAQTWADPEVRARRLAAMREAREKKRNQPD